MAVHRQEFRLRSLCRVLGVSRSGFYAWEGRPAPRREQRNEALLLHIRAAYERGRRAYGAPRVHQELAQRGIPCGRHRIARLMRREGIIACTERHFRWTATPRSELPAAPNRLQRQFWASAPNRRWISDITSLRTGQGWLHLAIVLDLFSRRIVGWAMHATLTQALAREALAMALADRHPAPGLLFHSDRGGQYLSASVQELLDAHGLVASTNRPGTCLDNAGPKASSTPSRPSSSTTTTTGPARTRAWPSSITSPRSTTEPVFTRASVTARPTTMKRSTLSPNPGSTFLGQHQPAACAG